MANPQGKTTLHPFWGAVWGLWFFAWVFCEIMIHAIPHVWILYLFLAFLPIELQGAMRKRWSKAPKGSRQQLGDTLSEFVWNFTQGGTARDKAGKCLALALAVRLAFLPLLFDTGTWAFPEIWAGGAWTNPWLLHTPTVLIAAGVGLWLFEHFPNEGRTG